ncbi:hypothetical protein MTO96_003766 [Rhipicephalus appendiculatus]
MNHGSTFSVKPSSPINFGAARSLRKATAATSRYVPFTFAEAKSKAWRRIRTEKSSSLGKRSSTSGRPQVITGARRGDHDRRGRR